MSKIPIVI
jgi:hypothetical protein